ncbi:MAG: trans-acting enoyl reductase family protein [Halioglobus sp.]
MSKQRDLGIVVYGATGFTGRLVAEYLNKHYGVNGDVNWAMAGRSQSKLESVRDELGIDPAVELVVADASDTASLHSMVERAHVVLTTVGPYQHYGNELVAACASAGTDYVDLCGEPTWMHSMIATHSDAAKASGARIVFSCGFDSVPFDLGVFFLQQAAQERFGKPLSRVRGRVRSMNGTWSGGTLASARATMEAAGKHADLINVLVNPFSLSDGFQGPEQPDGSKTAYDEVVKSWVAPFMMAVINTKNIHRSNYLLGHPYGEDFAYDEMIMTGVGDAGEAMAKAVSEDTSMMTDTTAPGEGPSLEQRESGSFDLLFAGETADGDVLCASVTGDKDPGYGSTCGMIAESAVALLLNGDAAGGGIWTPAPAMGSLLIDRLEAKAGLKFSLE